LGWSPAGGGGGGGVHVDYSVDILLLFRTVRLVSDGSDECLSVPADQE
jgi:hypothetical protein